MTRRRHFKVIIIGDGNVGKTSMRRRYFGEGFSTSYLITLGADFALKRQGTDAIQIWDLAGQAVYKPLRKNYYLGAHGALVVFDLDEPESFENLDKWIHEIESYTGKYIPVILIGNKKDLIEIGDEKIDPRRIENYREELEQRIGYKINYVETSAKTGYNIDHAFDSLIEQVKQGK